MAKRKKKETKKMIQSPIENSGLESILTRSAKDTINGFSPFSKRTQDDVLDILGENKLDIIDENGNSIDPNNQCGEIDWDSIKSPSKHINFMNKPLEEWGGKQLFLHLKYAVTKKYDKPWENIAIAGGIQSIRLLGEEISKLSGKPPSSPKIIKAYLDWFVLNEIDSQIAKKGDFFMSSLRNKILIKRFLKQYHEDAVIEQDTSPVIKETEVNFDNMDDLFRTSKLLFMTKYGVVITFNWLLLKKGFTFDKAKQIVEGVLKDVLKMDVSIAKEIAKATKSFSPYPVSYKTIGLDSLLDMVQEKNIQFSATAKGVMV